MPFGRAAFVLVALSPLMAVGQSQSTPSDSESSIEQRLQRLEQRQKELERALREKNAEVQDLKKQKSAQEITPGQEQTNAQKPIPGQSSGDAPPAEEPPPKWGKYTPNLGFKVADTDNGDMSISIYTYVRYLNQKALDPTYTNAFGMVSTIQQRQDVQLNKVQIKFLGWLLSQKFRYFLYAWTNNAAQGQGAQVVIAGNLNYTFNKYVTLSGGITSLPGTRSVEGNFPFWYSVDSRLMADEFFRPSYTSGLWVRGQITDTVKYQSMLGNNLSTLGVSAAQLDNHLNTWASALIWEPLGDFGLGFGDFENHEDLVSRVALHYTRSTEDKQSQPNNDAFENTQIRLADGTVIFTPNIFGPGITVNTLRYQMTCTDFGLKYRGWSLDGEFFYRWLNDFEGPGTMGLPGLTDHGYQLQTSYMVLRKRLQLYLGGSTIHGKYGNPWDSRAGVNVFPWQNKVVRWNTELLWLYKSATGGTSLPYPVGGNGFVFSSTLELAL